MNIQSLKSDIVNNTLGNFYIFTGPEYIVKRKYIEQMAKSSGRSVKNLESITTGAQKLNGAALLKNAEICVFYECKDICTLDSINAFIQQILAQKQHIFIFVFSTLDKRLKFYKNWADYVVEFEYLSPDILVRYIKKEIDLNNTNIQKLINICECSYGQILLELDKIRQFCASKNVSADEAFITLLQSGIIFTPPADAVFLFVDAVLKGKRSLSYSLLEESYASGEATLVLLANLYNNTKQLIQVQSYTGNNLASATGLTQFQINMAKERCGKYKLSKLMEFLKIIQSAESGIKMGLIDESIAVEYVLSNLWS